MTASRWRESPDYLFAFDLYNRGYFWEAHEVWESLWHEAPPSGVERPLLQALIQLAAARLKARQGDPANARRLLSRSRQRLSQSRRRTTTRGRVMGLDLDRLERDLESASPEDLAERGPVLRLG